MTFPSEESNLYGRFWLMTRAAGHGWGRGLLQCLLLAFFAMLLGTPSTQGAVIAVDARHSDLATGEAFSEFRATIFAAGHTIVSISNFTSAELDGVDALIARQPRFFNVFYMPDEISAIWEFVSGGNGLLFIGDGGRDTDVTYTNANAILAPYGLGFSSNVSYISGGTITGFVPHPLTLGVTSIGVDYNRALATITAPAIDLTVSAGFGNNILAGVTGENGAGNVVAYSDTDTWRNPGLADTSIAFGDNRQLLENIVQFIVVPEPASVALLGIGVVGFCCRRFRRGAASQFSNRNGF
jgi:hypothetical protein